jgi:hypothetical protein
METESMSNYHDSVHDNKVEVMLKSADVGYNRIKQRNGKYCEYYTSSGIGNHIRNAETGEYYESRVGTNDEMLFFSVIITSHKCKSKNSSNTLFYQSPEQYMSHFNTMLNRNIIDSWYKRRNEYISK